MSVLAAGTTVGFESKPWEMEQDGQRRSGVTHTLTVSTGDATESIKVREESFADLGVDVDKLRQFGRPVVVRCAAKAQDSNYGAAKLVLSLVDVEFVRMADLKTFGYSVDIYTEDDVPPPVKAAPAPVSNGAK